MIILPPIQLGVGNTGQKRREQLDKLAARAGFYWRGKPSIGRWVKHLGNIKMLSRKNAIVITTRNWLDSDDGKVKWLTVTTNKTGNMQFRIVGVYKPDSTTPHDDKMLVGSTVQINKLHCIPTASDVLANIDNGINFQIGVMDDGLNDLCGDLIFARLVNMTNKEYTPSEQTIDTAWQAARIFARTGIKQAVQFLKDSNLFKDVFSFVVGGPSCADDCVIEIEHESRP